MELSVRDWLIIVGVLLILAVLIDGYRRVRNERRGSIRMSLNKQFLNSTGSDELQLSELPGGKARIVGRRATDPKINPTLGDESRLNLDQPVPILMDSVGADEGFDNTSYAFSGAGVQSNQAFEEVPEDSYESPGQQAYVEEYIGESLEDSNQSSLNYSDDQDVFVINVEAKGEDFKGPDLLHILLACDMRYGEMNIFHRHEQANGVGPVQFSMANSVNPGVFDLDMIDGFTTRGVSFFMGVPGPEDPMKAFDYMVETAQCLVKNLGGELRDESRSVMTMQTLEHCRQRIREIERRQLTLA